MKILLSIKPEFAEKIFSGSKKYEFRRRIFKAPDVKTVVVYASTPIGKVIGEFEIDSVICTDIESLWKLNEAIPGSNKRFFLNILRTKKPGTPSRSGKLRSTIRL